MQKQGYIYKVSDDNCFMETKIFATYKKGVLIPENKLDLEDNSKVRIILEDDHYDSFSLAGQEDNLEDSFAAQKEILEND